MSHLNSIFHRFAGAWRRETSGNVSIIFAFSLIPMIGIIGLAVDYGMALSAKSKLDNAADAAAIAAVATAKAYVAANASSQSDPTLTTNAKSAGQIRGLTAFAVNAGSIPYAPTPTPIVTVTRNGQTFSSTVQYQTTSRNNFGQVFKQPTTLLAGTTNASADVPSYLDFYLLIDVSASMGLPSTSDGQIAVAAHSNDTNCQFACHYPDQAWGYNYAISNTVQLRSGAVNTAVCNLLTRTKNPSVTNQYRVGLYPFITQMATLSPIVSTTSSSDFATLWSAANCDSSPPMEFTTLLDSGTTQLTTNNDLSTGTGSGGTHFETSLATMQTTISPYGDGTSTTNSKPFVFLITDGMENNQYFDLVKKNKKTYPGGNSTSQQSNQSWWTGSSPQTIDTTACTSLKNKGAIISILYIPYTIGSFQNADTWETTLAQNVISGSPSLQTQLQSCATSGYFHTANTSADIDAALAAMLSQAIQMAHLLN